MPDRPTLLYLHGVAHEDPDNRWKETLSKSLKQAGYDSFDDVKVIAPVNRYTLEYPSDDKVDLPPITVKELSGDTCKQHRRAFDRRVSSMEAMLSRHDQGTGWWGGDGVIDAGVITDRFRQARRYSDDSQTRARVLDRVLNQIQRNIGQGGRVLIIGHSLGSVIAADLLRRLPTNLHVAGLVTIGSPLAHTGFHAGAIKKDLASPPANLDWWVNFWNDGDVVTTHRGVSSIIPWVLDQRIRGGLFDHDAALYLASPPVAAAIGYGLFGSSSRSLAQVEQRVAVPPDDVETVALVGLSYAHKVCARLEGDRYSRYASALRQVQDVTVQALHTRAARSGKFLPSTVAELDVDQASGAGPGPEPAPVHDLERAKAVVLLVSVAMGNVIHPFEINTPKEVRKGAMEDLAADLQFGTKFGADVVAAAEQAMKIVHDGDDDFWRWVLLVGGATALVVATGGLAMAAAPGLAGAAAITSGLAAFGPGGMIGGLLTAGTLATAGGGGIALAFASPATSAAAVESAVAGKLAVAMLRQRQGMEQEPETWLSLVESDAEIRREKARLSVVSDQNAPSIKEADRKIKAIGRALKYLHEKGLVAKSAIPESVDSSRT